MAIDEKFQLTRFAQLRDDADALETLSVALQKEVDGRLHEVVGPVVEEIVAQLNGLGHELGPYGDPVPGDIAYRDDRTEEGRYSCRLRLGVDVVVSVGFADTVDQESDLGPTS